MSRSRDWVTRSSELVFDGAPWVRVSEESVELPDGRTVDGFYRIRMRDFVCIYPETEDGKVLVIKQYKHGPRRVSLTFPGGHLEDGEDPVETAARELVEETGYEAADLDYLGGFVVAANQECATAHFVRATGCRQVSEPDSGDLEEMEIQHLDESTVWQRARQGDIVLLNQLALLTIATHPELSPRNTD